MASTAHAAPDRLPVAAGDEDLDAVPMSVPRGRHVVVEEKMDGANCGISFGPDLELRLQTGGPRERRFDLLKQWAAALAPQPLDRKVEEGGAVTGRYKFVRPEFTQMVLSDGHRQDRPLVPNRLADGAELFG